MHEQQFKIRSTKECVGTYTSGLEWIGLDLSLSNYNIKSHAKIDFPTPLLVYVIESTLPFNSRMEADTFKLDKANDILKNDILFWIGKEVNQRVTISRGSICRFFTFK